MDLTRLSLDALSLQRAYRQGLAPEQVVSEVYRRIAARGDDKVWLYLEPEERVLAQARALALRRARGEELPLFGLPYGVKDNVDVEGMPTSAGCAAFTYTARRSAAVVEKLDAAGALLLGKQNMDQFATGLVGVRTTTGHCANAFDARYVPGGSSSGSGVAVAAGIASFSIGSDTGGSGRVPAACNNIVGLKPTPGLASTRGFVWCNRSFDVPPVFALTVGDAWRVLRTIAGHDAEDAYSEASSGALELGALPARWRFALPRADQREFFGDAAMRDAFDAAVQALRGLGGEPFEIDFAPFLEAGKLVFNSALVAERWLAYGRTVEETPDAVHPAVATAIGNATHYSAADAFTALYRLKELQREVAPVFENALVLVTPTIGTLPTVAAVEADPMTANARMGHYTYFANPLRLSAVSVPAAPRADGLPCGVQLLAPGFGEARIGAVAQALERRTAGRLGATGVRFDEIPAA